MNKKTLLLIFALMPTFLMAQVAKVEGIEAHRNVTAEVTEMLDWHSYVPSSDAPIVPPLRTSNKKNPFNYVTLGETYYDLQSNASIGRRLLLHSDGKISATWTSSPTTSPTLAFPTRGSGYNHFNGTSWLAPQANPIEGVNRAGWPNIGLLSNGSEFLLGHEANNGGFYFSTNSGIGVNSWNTQGPLLDDESNPLENRAPIWGRAAASNGYVHILSNYTPSGNNVAVVRAGVTVPTTYSRMTEDRTIEISHILLPGYDSTLYAAGGGDNYAIDVRDSIVAIVMGGLGDPVSVWKSTNNGDSFTYVDVDKFQYKGASGIGRLFLNQDTAISNDGSVDIIIDHDGMAHVFYSTSAVLGGLTPEGDTGVSFFPARMRQINHWYEGTDEITVAAEIQDLDGDGVIRITSETFNALGAGGVLPGTLLSAARTGTTSLVTMPSASIDADGNIFLVYSSAVEQTDFSPLHVYNACHRDIFITYTTDNGQNWADVQSLTRDYDKENHFPCISKTTDDNIHVIFQQDDFPGTFLQNQNDAGYTHPNVLNSIMYVTVPKTEVMAGNIGLVSLNKLESLKKIAVVGQNYPNPFHTTSDVTVYMDQASDVSLVIRDITGKEMGTTNYGILGAGNHMLTIDATNYPSGIYFYTLSTENFSTTKKMSVVK